MCGRFTQPGSWDEIAGLLPGLEPEEDPLARYNVAPSQTVLTVLNDGKRKLTASQWGLIPFWAKDPSIGNRMINARSETAHEKPAFKRPLAERRCLIVANGFYEWGKVGPNKQKMPVYFQLDSGQPFTFAGLWNRWHPPEGKPLITCTILTCEANKLVGKAHHRMPVILPPETREQWISPEKRSPERMREFLVPFPAGSMQAAIVSGAVNNPGNEGPQLVEPQQSDLFE